ATVRVGGTLINVNGTLAALPRWVGSDLEVAATGSNLGELSALTRLQLPSRPFDLRGRFLRRADGLAIDATVLRVAGATIQARGASGEPPPPTHPAPPGDGARA